MKRLTWIYLHLGLASLFMPFMLLMPITGGLYLLGESGEMKKSEAFMIEGRAPDSDREVFFRDQFKSRGLDFDFEYIRESGKDFTFRPSSRIHYSATQMDNGIQVFRLEPSWLKRLVEIHKGHGPQLLKWIQVAFSLTLILVALSGVYLAWLVPAYRKVMGLSFAVGLVLILAAALS